MKSYCIFFKCNIFQIAYSLCSTSVFTCIVTMVPNFAIFSIFSIVPFKLFLYKYNRFLHFWYDSLCSFVNNFFFLFLKLIIFIPSPLKILQSFLMQSLPLYPPFLFSISLIDDKVDIEKPDGVCSPNFL